MSRIEDVAERAGVSMKTVSRVLNGEPHVREALQLRVRKAAAELHYKPNQAARRLAGRRSFLIALMYHNPTLTYIAAIQSGAARKCRELGYHLVVESLDEKMSDFSDVANTLIDVISPDGVILIPPVVDLPQLLAVLKAKRTPVAQIAAGSRGRGLHIFMDERGAGQEMTEHLIALGHERIAMVRGPETHHAAMARFDGFRDALRDARIPLRKSLVAEGSFDVESGHKACLKLMSQATPPTAIFAGNDQMALGVMNAARSLGLSIPGDVSIAGFDDSPMAIGSWPKLTTIRQPLVEMGEAAVTALMSSKPASVQVEYQLVIRGSTAAPRPGG
ncbi:MAG: LacI family DNA-binding transcriptional regulator [Hyphomonadaceae bacterium]|nr:LacI family DNA-binding transcriptional regulator [Hyphomonadaceae bacterium]